MGTYIDGAGNTEGLLLSETDGIWATGVEADLPANAAPTQQFVHLDSVSCSSAGNCSAVGTYSDNSINDNGEGLLLTETAGAWSQGVEVVLPANASSVNQYVHLFSVSCASAGNCKAVGIYLNNLNNGRQGLLLSETAGAWSAGITPALPGNASATQSAGVDSVSCVSAGNCTAVGFYTDNSNDQQGLVLTASGGSWATGVEVASPANATANPNAYIDSVSCASAGNCTAVGSYTDNTLLAEGLLLTETAGSWATGVEALLPANATTQAPGPLYSLGSVSCASAGNCTAVGSYTDSSVNNDGLLLTETDGTWATGVEAALPANAATSQQVVSLGSVSCPTAGNCSAVGGYNAGSGGGGGLLLTETAGSWATGTEVSLPANGYPGPNYISINAISCASVGDCSGVGWYGVSTGGGNEGLLLGTTTMPLQETLSVSKSGAGSGTVASSPSGIDCGATCASSFDIGTEVTLTATPSANSYLIAWSGAGSAGCDNIDPCHVALNSDTTVTANFGLKSYLLTVQKSGSGSGWVSSPAGIYCNSTCETTFDAGAKVPVTATPDPGSTFTGWSGGGCSGIAGCLVTVGANTTITATFGITPKPMDCLVPKVAGKTVTAAKLAIRAHDCTLGRIRHAASRMVKKGHVISQKPKRGSRLKHGAKVNLVVSKGRG